jgi:hypothetical protein
MDTIDVEPAPTPPYRTPRSIPWLWTAAIAVIAVAVVAAVLWWPSGLSDEPPWGLDEVDMPVTEADMLAVVDGMPDIDGNQPTFNQEGFAGIVSYGDSYRSIFILPADEPPGAENSVDLIRQAVTDAEAAGDTVEASNLESSGGLVWVAVTETETDDGVPAYHLMWTEPDGSWFLHLIADSPEFRVKLVHAFIEATNQQQ